MGGGTGRFGHAKAFEDGQVEAPEELEHFLADGCRARAQQEGAVQPEGLTNLPEHLRARSVREVSGCVWDGGRVRAVCE